MEINNTKACICIETNIAPKEFFRYILENIPNSLSGDKLSNVLLIYLNKVQSEKIDLDSFTKSRISLSRHIIMDKLKGDNVYILDKDSWEDTNTVLIMMRTDCEENKINPILFEFLTIKNQFDPEDFELSYGPLKYALINNIESRLDGICCRFYYISNSNDLSIHPNNWSVTIPNFLNKLGNFKIHEIGVVTKEDNFIQKLSIEEDAKGFIRVELKTKFVIRPSFKLIKEAAMENFKCLKSLMEDK